MLPRTREKLQAAVEFIKAEGDILGDGEGRVGEGTSALCLDGNSTEFILSVPAKQLLQHGRDQLQGLYPYLGQGMNVSFSQRNSSRCHSAQDAIGSHFGTAASLCFQAA